MFDGIFKPPYLIGSINANIRWHCKSRGVILHRCLRALACIAREQKREKDTWESYKSRIKQEAKVIAEKETEILEQAKALARSAPDLPEAHIAVFVLLSRLSKLYDALRQSERVWQTQGALDTRFVTIAASCSLVNKA